MSSEFLFNNKAQQNLGRIDFTKIKSGLKKEDIAGSNELVKSLFDILDKNSDGTLNREEILSLQQMLIEADKDTNNEISEKEARKIQLGNGHTLGKKNIDDFLSLISSLVQKSETEGVVSVTESEEASEIITYNDGRVEKHYRDGRIELITRNGDNEQIEIYNKNGKLSYRSSISENGSTIVEVYDADGNSITSELTSNGNYTVTQGSLTTRYEDGLRIIEVNGRVAEELLANGSKIVHNEDGTRTLETSSENVSSYLYFDNNNDLICEITYTENEDESKNFISTDYDLYGNQIVTTKRLVRNSSTLLEQKYISVDGKEITLSYDQNGNTSGVIVQYGETIDMIARTFGVNKDELLSLNRDKIKGSGSNIYFEVGESITIPKCINVNSENIVNRSSAEEAKAEAELATFLKEQERLNAKRAEDLRIQEERIETRAKAIEETQELMQEFCEFGVSSGIVNAFRLNDTGRKVLNSLNENNVIEFYEAFTPPNTVVNYLGTDSNYIDQHFQMMRNIAQKVGIPNDLIRSYETGLRNVRSGATTSTTAVNDLLRKFIALINSYRYYIGTNEVEHFNNPSEEVLRNAQAQVVSIFEQWITQAEEAFNSQLSADGICAGIADKVSILWGSENRANVVREDFKQAKNNLKKLKACQTVEEFKSLYKEIFGVEFDFLAFVAAIRKQEAIEQARPIIEQLDSEISFLEKFVGKQVTGKESHDYYGGAHTAYYPTLSMRYDDYIAYKQGNAPEKGYSKENRYDREIYSYVRPEKFEEDLNEAIEYLGGRDAVLNAVKSYYINVCKFSPAEVQDWTIENNLFEVVEYIQQKLETKYNSTVHQRNRVLGGMSIQEARLDASNSITGLFGTKDNIMTRVMEYNYSQQMGDGLVKGITIAGAAMIATICQQPWLAAAIVMLGTPTLEAIDSATTGAALKELRSLDFSDTESLKDVAKEFGRWAHAYSSETWNQYDGKAVLTNMLVSIVSMGAGMAASRFATTFVQGMQISSKLLQAFAQVLIEIEADLAVGIVTDYVVHGEVTIQGVVYNLAFSIVGNTISRVSLKPKTQTVRQTANGDIDLGSYFKTCRGSIDINEEVSISRPTATGETPARAVLEMTASNGSKLQIPEFSKVDIERLISILIVKGGNLAQTDIVLIKNYIKNVTSLDDLAPLESLLKNIEMDATTQRQFTELIDMKRENLDLDARMRDTAQPVEGLEAEVDTPRTRDAHAELAEYKYDLEYYTETLTETEISTLVDAGVTRERWDSFAEITNESGKRAFSKQELIKITSNEKMTPEYCRKILEIKDAQGKPIYNTYNITSLIDEGISSEAFYHIASQKTLAGDGYRFSDIYAIKDLSRAYDENPALVNKLLNSPRTLDYAKISDLFNLGKNSPELLTKMLDMTNPDGSIRFDIFQLKELLEQVQSNPELLTKMLDMTNPDGTFKFDEVALGRRLRMFSSKSNPNITETMFLNMLENDVPHNVITKILDNRSMNGPYIIYEILNSNIKYKDLESLIDLKYDNDFQKRVILFLTENNKDNLWESLALYDIKNLVNDETSLAILKNMIDNEMLDTTSIIKALRDGEVPRIPSDTDIESLKATIIEETKIDEIVAQEYPTERGFNTEKLKTEYIKILSDMKSKNPDKYQRLLDSGAFELVQEGKLAPSIILGFINNNYFMSNRVLNEITRIHNGDPLVIALESTSDLTNISRFVPNGDVCECNGKLYVNDNGNPVEIKLTKEKFEELFPPLSTTLFRQGALGDCWLVSTLDNFMNSPKGRVELYKLFEQRGNDVLINFPDGANPILFKDGQVLKIFAGQISVHAKGCNEPVGIQMIEQAFAVHRYSKYDTISDITDIANFSTSKKELMENLVAGTSIEATNGLTKNIQSTQMLHNIDFDLNNSIKIKNMIIQYANDSNALLFFSTKGTSDRISLADEYNIVGRHAYSIKGYNESTGMVYISNPHHTAILIEIPIYELVKYAENFSVAIFN